MKSSERDPPFLRPPPTSSPSQQRIRARRNFDNSYDFLAQSFVYPDSNGLTQTDRDYFRMIRTENGFTQFKRYLTRSSASAAGTNSAAEEKAIRSSNNTAEESGVSEEGEAGKQLSPASINQQNGAGAVKSFVARSDEAGKGRKKNGEEDKEDKGTTDKVNCSLSGTNLV